jgi:hypothetical protein
VKNPQTFISFAPFGVGILCALCYAARSRNIHGWWIGARDTEYRSAYFTLDDYFTTRPTRFYATDGTDLVRGWTLLYSSRRHELEQAVPVDEEALRELNRLREHFVDEWLFFRDDAGAAGERAEYDRTNFPLRDVNLRIRCLARFSRREPVWIHRSHGFDMEVLQYLQRHWPIDYRYSSAV